MNVKWPGHEHIILSTLTVPYKYDRDIAIRRQAYPTVFSPSVSSGTDSDEKLYSAG